MDVVNNSLDSPGTSSGYCSGTEEEMAFTVSMFETGLPTGDIFAGGGSSSFPSYMNADGAGLDCAFPRFCQNDSLMLLNTDTSSTEARTGNEDERNFRELRDSWLFEMLFGTQSTTSGEDPGRPYHLEDLDTIDFDSQLLSVGLAEKTEEDHTVDDYPEEVLRTICGPLRVGGCCEEAATTGEEDWNALMPFDGWDEVVCADDDDEVLLVGDDLTLKDILSDANQSSDENAAKRKLCDADGTFDTLQLSPELQTPRMTCCADAVNRIANDRIEEVTTSESTPSFHAPPTGPSLIRPDPRPKLSGDQSSRPRNHFRRQGISTQPQRTSSTSTTLPPTQTTTTHHMLEDHRYSSRRLDQVVKPVITTTTTTWQREVERPSSRYSALETLLRTSVRFNPNHGSSFILTKESKKRSSLSNPQSSLSTPRHSPPGGGGQQGKRPRSRSHSNTNNTLLHDLLTCRMEEVEKRRGGIRRNEIRGSAGKDQMDGGRNCSLLVGLIPSDDPVVDCSFLYEEDQYHQFQDHDLNVEDHGHGVDARMAWMEDDKVIQYASDDESDTWFANYFNQSS